MIDDIIHRYIAFAFFIPGTPQNWIGDICWFLRHTSRYLGISSIGEALFAATKHTSMVAIQPQGLLTGIGHRWCHTHHKHVVWIIRITKGWKSRQSILALGVWTSIPGFVIFIIYYSQVQQYNGLCNILFILNRSLIIDVYRHIPFLL